jgi:hypothetical protein
MIATSLISFSQPELQRLAAAHHASPIAPAALRHAALAIAACAIVAGVAMGLWIG